MIPRLNESRRSDASIMGKGGLYGRSPYPVRFSARNLDVVAGGKINLKW